ncbi:MAG: Dyp-type peroxidase, partial [Proteobacteria bacterium]|nr:Dyp-type peroxidase [Pseudomonadota bacterium]
MPAPVQDPSRTLRGITDLTLAAPLKRGLVAAPDARSHETRLSLLLRSLNTLRYASLEIDPAPAIPDMIDRVRALQSFRLALTDGPDGSRLLVLAVSFDGGWEPYMRRVWRDLGPLLDVIFCNCEGYLLARTHPYAEYARWVRSAQRATEFFYTASPVTVNDLHWLRAQQRAPAPPPPVIGNATLAAQALPGLAALYRLTELYPPGTPDGDCLLHAAHHLLRPLWTRMSATPPTLLPAHMPCHTPTEEAAVAWFMTQVAPTPAAPAQACPARAHWPPPDAQAGIVQALPATPTHGALLLIECDDARAIGELVCRLDPATLGAQTAKERSGPWRNLFFTLAGLRKARVPDGLLACLPTEFLQGMEARAAVLGDLEADHPQHWALPERNWPLGAATTTPTRVALSSVHVVAQILVASATPGWHALDAQHPAYGAIDDFQARLPKGARILSVEPLHRNIDAGGQAREHFGFADGLSNPMHPDDQPAGSPRAGDWDRWALGDYLLGYGNSHDDPPLQGRFWTDSTFLVVRKLRQDVDALHALVGGPPGHSGLAALMVGRQQDGRNLVDGTLGNAFDYANDPMGALCPLHSHVRRANPRVRKGQREDLQVLPRILRRGMSYGPPHTAQTAQEERGVVFMAYNASIAEQFELIQSWLSGGNSGGDGSYSGQRDPIFARPREGDRDSFVFGPCPRPGALPLPPGAARPVALQWGLYLFVPSVPALQDIARFATEAGCPAAASDPAAAERAAEAKKGAMVIAKLKAAESALGLGAAREQWKLVLEDLGARQNGTSQWLWTAVRELHGGVLRTPYGVLVGRRDQVMEVFGD